MTSSTNNLFNNLDPDENYFDELFPSISDSSQSPYFTISEFNSLCKDSDNKITILSYNIRSFNSNADNFFAGFDRKTLPAIIVLAETWFKPENAQSIPGYKAYHTFRLGERRSGGISIFVEESLYSRSIGELCISNPVIESCTIEIDIGGESWCLLGIYRPHSGTPENFLNSLEHMFSNNKLRNKKCMVLGDINIDLLKEDSEVDGFVAGMRSYHYVPIITKPTRFPPDDSQMPSLLDHIWLNSPVNFNSGIILNDLTDHTPIFVQLKISPPPKENSNHQKVHITFRSNTEENKVPFLHAVADFDWEALASGDVDEYMERFSQTLNRLYCENFPLKTKYLPKKRLDNPWLTPRLLELVKLKSSYFKLFKLGIISKEENNRFKNKVKSIVHRDKLNYYKKLFNDNRNNIIQTWNVIKSIISQNPIKKNTIKKIIFNNTEFFNNQEIANIFNNYYCEIALDLDNSIPTDNNTNPCSLISQNAYSSIYLNPVSIDECNKILNQLKIVKQDKNSIPVQLIKNISCYIAPVLSGVIKLGFSTGVFPGMLKSAVITPIFKSGDPCILQNYRPISNLPIFAKVFERCIYNRIFNFITRFKIISPKQYGFIKGLSTESAVLSLVEYLYEVINNKEIAVNVFIDFRKAFDTVNHSILFKKLELYGIRGLPLKLIKSYFSNRSQRVRIGESISSVRNPTIGLPQGSVLSSIFFLLFINDLPKFSNVASTILYADDTTISLRDTSVHNLINSCNEQLSSFYDWSTCNRLTINTEKTFYMIITNQKLETTLSPVKIASNEIHYRSSEKFLGVVLDDRIKFNLHVSMLCNKVSRAVGVLYKLRDYLPLPTLISLYYTFVYPYFVYCNVIWGHTFRTHLKPLEILQKKVIRIINHAPYNSHTNNLFFTNKILKLNEINLFFQSVHVYKSYDDFPSFSHSYSTRNHSNLNPAFQRTVSTQRSLRYSALTIWNQLPPDIKNAPTLSIFKNKLKSHLINKYANPS